MGAFIARQPNGLLCRFSSVVDCITDYNMTEEEYIEMCAEKARKEERDVLDHYIKPFEMVDRYFFPNNMTIEEHKRIMKEMEEPAEKETHIP
jgi:hypothetical protein